MKKLSMTLIAFFFVILLAGCPGLTNMFNPDETEEKSNVATLSGLMVTAGQVDYNFIPVEDTYEITVGGAVDSVSIAPVFSNANASMTINGIVLAPNDVALTRPLDVGMNTFTLIVTAEDGAARKTYAITVIRLDNTATEDLTPPVILLSGDNPLFLELNENFTEPGYTATDSEEGDLSSAVVITGTVDTGTPGVYTLYYNISDSSGNAAIPAVRVVYVWDTSEGDTVPPLITLNGDNPMYVNLDDTFTDPGAGVSDNIDADRTIYGTGTVDTTIAGSYTLSYNAVDDAGNAAEEMTRSVVVIESIGKPTIDLLTGTYESSQTVTITHPNPDVRIIYVLENLWNASDNSWLTDENIGILYSGPITISDSTTLLARAFLDGIDSVASSRADYAIIPPGETNMIANGDFTKGLSLWWYWAGGTTGAEAVFSEEDGVFTISISAGGDDNWNVNSYYRPRFLLEQDEYYQLNFSAWAESERQIHVQLHEEGIDNNGDGSSYSEYLGRTVSLTTSPQEFSFLMQMNDIDDPQASLRFNLGIETADVYIDDISLENVVPTLTVLTEADVPDPNLRAAFEDITGKSFGEITNMDLLQIGEGLHLSDMGITNIRGLEYCDLVYYIALNENDLSGADANLSILSGMDGLRAIDICNCSLQDLDFLTELNQLDHININGNEDLAYSDIQSLNSTNLPLLKGLYFNAQDTDGDGSIDPVSGIDWTGVVNTIAGHTQLHSLGMSHFGCSAAMVTELTDALNTDSTRWRSLSLNHFNEFENTGITDLSWITGMINLRYLDLDSTNISDLTPIKTLYDAGGFSNLYTGLDKDIDLRFCGLDITPGSTNKTVVDYLIEQGLRVEYEDGNDTGTGEIDITIQ